MRAQGAPVLRFTQYNPTSRPLPGCVWLQAVGAGRLDGSTEYEAAEIYVLAPVTLALLVEARRTPVIGNLAVTWSPLHVHRLSLSSIGNTTAQTFICTGVRPREKCCAKPLDRSALVSVKTVWLRDAFIRD